MKENGILFTRADGARLAIGHQDADGPGAAGDRLWVRETFVAYGLWETRHNQKKQRSEWYFIDMTRETGQAYRFDRADPAAVRRAGVAPCELLSCNLSLH